MNTTDTTYTTEKYIEAIRENLPVIIEDMTDGNVYQRQDEDCMGFHETNFRVSLSNGAVIQFTIKELVEPDADENDDDYDGTTYATPAGVIIAQTRHIDL